MTELDFHDYQRFYGDDYTEMIAPFTYGCIVKIQGRNMYHTEIADSAIEAWIQCIDRGLDIIYVKLKEHD